MNNPPWSHFSNGCDHPKYAREWGVKREKDAVIGRETCRRCWSVLKMEVKHLD